MNYITTTTTTTGDFTGDYLKKAVTQAAEAFKSWPLQKIAINLPEIEKVIFQKEHTIIIWKDKVKTVVKCSNEDFDKEKGLAMAICKRYMDRSKFKKLIETADIQDK